MWGILWVTFRGGCVGVFVFIPGTNSDERGHSARATAHKLMLLGCRRTYVCTRCVIRSVFVSFILKQEI